MSKFKNMKLRYKIGVGVATTAAVVGGAGAAFAYWTAGGSGGGSGTVAAGNGTVTLVASFPTAGLYPGGNVPVTIKAYNTSATNLFVTSVVDAATPIAVSGGCTLGDFSLQAAPTMTPTAGSEVSTAHNSLATAVTVATDTLTYANSDVDQSNCKNGTITLSYTSS